MAIPLASHLGELPGYRAGPHALMRVKTQKSSFRQGHHLCFAGGCRETAQIEGNRAPLLHGAQGSGKREPEAAPRSPAGRAPRKCMRCVLAISRSIWNGGFQAENTEHPHEHPFLRQTWFIQARKVGGNVLQKYRGLLVNSNNRYYVSGFCDLLAFKNM